MTRLMSALALATIIASPAAAIDLGPTPACSGFFVGVVERQLVEYVTTHSSNIGGGLDRIKLGQWSTIDLRHPPRCYGPTPCKAAIPPDACAAYMSVTGMGQIGSWPESIAAYIYFRAPGSSRPCSGSVDGEFMVTRQSTGEREVLGTHLVPVVDGKIEVCVRGVTNMKPDRTYIRPGEAFQPVPISDGSRATFGLNIGVTGWVHRFPWEAYQ